ncbi:uroporphyrinogen-III synthase [Dyella telluris]|uniref:Uroporphyrinogen-III synthase n=1 Tax=Dyella telluris TaxID=2763498 RepID=A0A7G8Q6C4_9GAMM|nr:uroporphyrinogen-III synthase [Dyella telluris]QNK02332.1 uroporphyrinogen-III synthase [Dyella telluris]
MHEAVGTEGPLGGRCIAVPESRELDVFAALLERRGASVLRCPLVDIRNAADPAPVLAWIREINAGTCDDLLVFTGEGLHRLLGAIDRHEPGLRTPFVEQLAAMRIIARGPKPGRVLRELGLRPDVVVEPATTQGMIGYLQQLDLHGRRVGVQLYGTDPNTPLMDFLAAAGAIVRPVAPYRYADASDDAAVTTLMQRMTGGGIDAVAFTSLQQVERLFRLADRLGQRGAWQAALSQTVVAAVGPLVVESLARHGVAVQAVPEGSYYLKPLTQALIGALAR